MTTHTRHIRPGGSQSVALTETKIRDELFARWGLRMYAHAKRCPECGTLNYQRRVDGVCGVCVRKGP